MTSESLSAENVLATSEQREIEDRALRLMDLPAMKRARDIATLLWRNAVAWPARDQMGRFDNMIEEYLFHHAMRAANGDPLHPGIARFMTPRHHWFGRDVPGSRWAGDSPDFIYRVIPVTHGMRYRLHGSPACANPPTVNYALMGDSNAAPVVQQLLDSLDMVYAPDGSFVITIDGEPAAGRTNHLQTRPGSDHILIRDALGDWIGQSPYRLTLERLDVPDRGPWDEDMLAGRAAKNLLEGFYYTYYCTRSGSGQAPNIVRAPSSSAAFGGMPTQWGAKGNLCLEEDEALLVTLNGAGARFRNTLLVDAFMMTIDYATRTSSLNMDQMAADAGGDGDRFTVVVAHRDPGIHNWLDTGGLRETIFGQRWQAFARDGSAGAPELAARLVKLDAVEQALPAGVRRIDAAGRAAQIAARQAGVARRFLDH